jgi:hypothetical protein
MRIVVNAYKDDGTFFAKLPLSVKDETYLNDLVEDIDCFLEENYFAIEDEGDDE